jgi:hypothetical protein
MEKTWSSNSLVIGRKEIRKIFRRELRLEENTCRHEERNRIINANSDNKRLFFKFVKKQRNNGNVLIDDLYVNDNLYQGSDVVNGWHEHLLNHQIVTCMIMEILFYVI